MKKKFRLYIVAAALAIGILAWIASHYGIARPYPTMPRTNPVGKG